MGPCFGQWALRIIIKWQWTYGYQKILIEEIILCTTYKNHWATTELTCYVSMNEVWRKQIYIIEWELRWWFSACHCERNVSLYDARCTITKSLIFFYLLHTTINRWNTLRNLHDDICLNKHIYYIMSWEICQVALLQCGSMNQGMHRSQMKIEWYFSTSHNNQPYSNVICEMRDHWWTLEIKFVSIMIRLNTIVQQYISIKYVGWLTQK